MALHHAISGEVVDLRPMGASLADATSTALVKTDRFEVIRLVLRAGATIPAHGTPGYVTLHCLEGDVSLGPVDATLTAGEWVYLDRGEPHSIHAIRDASVLFTIFFD